MKYFLFALLLLLIASCENNTSCTYQLENGLEIIVYHYAYDVSLNDYIIEKSIELTNKKGEVLVFQMPDSERHTFFVAEREIVLEQDTIKSLWFYTSDRPTLAVVDIEQMHVLTQYKENYDNDEYCHCNTSNCETDCIRISYCKNNLEERTR